MTEGLFTCIQFFALLTAWSIKNYPTLPYCTVSATNNSMYCFKFLLRKSLQNF